MTGQLLALSGLPERATPGAVPMDTVNTLSLAYAAVVAVFAIAIALVIRRFPITRADHEARLAALSAARANPDAEGMHP
jgi:GPH family glycoside/pentoside/hexuronide:cation symporter